MRLWPAKKKESESRDEVRSSEDPPRVGELLDVMAIMQRQGRIVAPEWAPGFLEEAYHIRYKALLKAVSIGLIRKELHQDGSTIFLPRVMS